MAERGLESVRPHGNVCHTWGLPGDLVLPFPGAGPQALPRLVSVGLASQSPEPAAVWTDACRAA